MNFTLHFLLAVLVLVCVTYIEPTEGSMKMLITPEPLISSTSSGESGDSGDSVESGDDGDSPESPEETESGEEDDGMSSDDDEDSSEENATEDPLEDDGASGDSDDPEEEESAEDICADAEDQSECGEEVDAAGDPLCAFNEVDEECFAIVRAHGVDANSYQNGLVSARHGGAAQDSLSAVVGVLCGVIGVLLFVIIGGGYWMWKQLKSNRSVEILADVNEGDHVEPEEDIEIEEVHSITTN